MSLDLETRIEKSLEAHAERMREINELDRRSVHILASLQNIAIARTAAYALSRRGEELLADLLNLKTESMADIMETEHGVLRGFAAATPGRNRAGPTNANAPDS